MYKIHDNLTNLLVHHNFQYHKFVNRFPPISNNLPDIVVSAPNLLLFKNRCSEFDQHDISIADLMF